MATDRWSLRKKRARPFHDKLDIYIDDSGTPYVLPTDILFSEEQKKDIDNYIRDLRSKKAPEKK